MNIRKILFTLSCIVSLLANAMEEQQEKVFQPLTEIAIKAFFNQSGKNIATQLKEYKLPEELYDTLFKASSLKNDKKTYIALFRASPSLDCTKIAISIATQQDKLSLKDKLDILCIFRHTAKPHTNTKKILNSLRRAIFKQVESKNNSLSNLFHSVLNCEKTPAFVVELLLPHALFDTDHTINTFITTFKNLEPNFYEEALKKLSLLVNTNMPYNNRLFTSFKPSKKQRPIVMEFPNPYGYFQHEIACIAKQDLRELGQGKSVNPNNEPKKAFFVQASDIVKPKA